MRNSLQKIDKFYLTLILTLVVLSGLVIFAFRGVFSAYLTAYEIKDTDLQSGLKVDSEKLNEAYSWAFTKHTIPLEVR